MEDTDYAFGRRSAEYERLIEQAEIFRPLTGSVTATSEGSQPVLAALLALFASVFEQSGSRLDMGAKEAEIPGR